MSSSTISNTTISTNTAIDIEDHNHIHDHGHDYDHPDSAHKGMEPDHPIFDPDAMKPKYHAEGPIMDDLDETASEVGSVDDLDSFF